MINQAMVFDEFTFPEFVDKNSLSHFGFLGFHASSLWYASPSAVSNCYDGDSEPFQEAEYAFKQNAHERKSISTDDYEISAVFHDVDDSFGSGDEKMDMLWEDFNDELGRASLRRTSFVGNDIGGFNRTFSHSVLGYKFDVISPLKMSKRSTSSVNHRSRRLSLRVILKVLKKLLLLSRTRCPRSHDM